MFKLLNQTNRDGFSPGIHIHGDVVEVESGESIVGQVKIGALSVGALGDGKVGNHVGKGIRLCASC